jgi:CHASE1-domain containing sensor protein
MFTGLGASEKGALLYNAIYHSTAPVASEHSRRRTLGFRWVLMNLAIIFILFIVDNIGRRKPLLYATPLLSLLFIIFAVLNAQNKFSQNKSASSGGVAVMFLFNIVYSFSFGPMGWTYVSEIIVSHSHYAGPEFWLNPRSRFESEGKEAQ